jgi:purine-binding chemotaxis protein CheW
METLETIFERRAEALAAAPPSDAPDDTFDALVFCLGTELFAFSGKDVLEVRPLGWLTRLAGTPACIAGLINVRGRIVPVIDLRPLIGLPSEEGPCMSVVLVSHRDSAVGILTTDRPTVRLLRAADLKEPPAPALLGLGVDPSSVRGITPGPVVVLDAERLLADSRLIVQHDFPPKA